MKNKEFWKESKFVYHKGRLRASRDRKHVALSSRLIVDITASFYEKNLPYFAKGNLLDLGCGKVPLYNAYKNLIFDNTCVDWDNSQHGNEFLDLNANLNLKLDLKSNQFDTIILSDVLEHIKEPKMLWQEMARILVSDGVLLFNSPFFYWLHEEPYDYYRYTKHALIAMAEESGFEVIKIEALGGAPEIMADITSKIIKKIPMVGIPMASMIQTLTMLFIKTKFGKKLSKYTSGRFPIAYGLIAKKIN